MWDAKNDRAPLLALSGQVQTQVAGTGAFQEVDLVRAFQSVADFNHRVQADSKHAELMNLAIKHATVNREVSHLTFPDDVQIVDGEGKSAGDLEDRIADYHIHPAPQVVDQALEKLKQAKRPTIIVGHGARFEMDDITAFAERLNAPVLTTFKGKGLISDKHPLGCGVLGRSGTPIASYFMNEADLLIVFGASFSNHTGITPKIPTIQVDFDRMALAKFHKIDVPIWGELGETARLLMDRLDASHSFEDRKPAIAERWDIWHKEKAKRMEEDFGNGISPVAVFDAMNRHIPANAAIAVDVGNNTYSFGRYFECQEQSIVMSGYLGSIGFGYPAAMGLWAAAGDSRPIVAVTGDGGFGQYPMEVTTAVKYGMPIKHILLNNKELGKISKEQRAVEYDVWQTSLQNPNFAEFVSSFGALGIRVEKLEDLDAAFEKVMAHDGPATVEIMTDALLI